RIAGYIVNFIMPTSSSWAYLFLLGPIIIIIGLIISIVGAITGAVVKNKSTGNNLCSNCGARLSPGYNTCPKCGKTSI
ncbi:MAG: zinc ribbon domain-containing protein, partial [Candidatus Odinarchaeota archaeon]